MHRFGIWLLLLFLGRGQCQGSCLLSINHGNVIRKPTVRPPLGPWARHNDYGEAHCDPGYAISGGIKHVKCKRGNWDPKPTCSPRKIFLSHQEWASFLGQGCCAPIRELGFAWNSEICPLDWPWSFPTISETDSQTNLLNECSRPSPCLRQEVEEYSRLGYDEDERMQVWAALRGVKVPKFGNQCCWTDSSTTYECFEYPSWLN